MLQSLPVETTQLLIDLCTSTGSLDEPPPPVEISPSTRSAAPGPSYLSYLALNRGTAATTVVSSDTAMPPSPSIKTIRAATERELRRSESVYEAGGSETLAPATSPLTTRNQQHTGTTMNGATTIGSAVVVPLPSAVASPSPVKRLSPRIYFHHFVDHLEQFVVFLEAVAARRWRQNVNDQTNQTTTSDILDANLTDDEDALDKLDQVSVWNTLLELYLTLPSRMGGNGVNSATKGSTGVGKFDENLMRDKALRVLRSTTIPYDTTHALMLCSTHGFTQGIVLLYERMGMYEDVLRFWMDKHNEGSDPTASNKVIEQLMHYGSDHPQLYPLVLRFLTSTPELLKKHQEDMKGILVYIDEEGLIPPLGVIQVLSRNGVASVGLVREWLIKRIRDSQAEIQNVWSIFSFPPYDFRAYSPYRTRILRNHIDSRQRPNLNRWQSSQTQMNPGYSMLQGVRPALASWIFPVFISCATTHITKGEPFLFGLIPRSTFQTTCLF